MRADDWITRLYYDDGKDKNEDHHDDENGKNED